MPEGWARQFPARWVPIAFLVIVLVDVAVFAPSWSHTVRGDHVAFLAETARESGWWAHVSKTWSWDRTRSFNTNATELFRPVQFGLLATETAVFGYRFVLWQLVGFAIHVLIVWRLFKLLLLVRPTVVAPLLALFFSVMLFPMEQVIWHHLHGYLLFSLILVLLLEQVWRHESEGQSSTKRFAAIAALVLVGCFTHEAMTGLALIVAGYLAWVHPVRTARRAVPLALLGAVAVYAVVSVIDYRVRGCRPTPELRGSFTIAGTAGNLAYTVVAWVAGGLWPALLERIVNERLTLWPAKFLLSSRAVLYAVPGVFVAAVLAAFATLARRGWSETKPRWRFSALAVAMMLGWATLYAAGRFNAMGADLGVAYSPYYSYPVWLLLLIAAHALVDPLVLGRVGRTLLGAAFAASLVMNAGLTWQTNVHFARWSVQRARVLAHVEEMIRAKAPSAEFEAFGRAKVEGNPPMHMLRFDADPDRAFTLIEVLWPNRFPAWRRWSSTMGER